MNSGGGSARVTGDLAQHDLAGGAVDGDGVALVAPSRPPAVKLLPSIWIDSAPTTAGLPQPRATTAAWLTSPPREVRMPSATIMPWTSSGDVSVRTSTTCSPRSAAAAASSAVK